MPVISNTHPISGHNLKALHELLATRYPNLNDLDFACILNVPPLKVNELKRAVPGGRSNSSEAASDEGKTRARVMKPTHAILVRLLTKHPEFTPLPPEPTSREVWKAISPFMPRADGWSKQGPGVNRIGFAPLFGRSSVSSYKLLAEDDFLESSTSANVIRLYMLVMGKFAEIMVSTVTEYLEAHAPASVVAEFKAALEPDWTVMRWEQDVYRYIPAKGARDEVKRTVYDRRRAWFDLYLSVLHDEAVSRDLDPEVAIKKGAWRNNEDVTDQQMRRYDPRQRPILGRYSPELQEFKNGKYGDLTNAEFYWILGMQVKAYYSARSKGHQRLDAPTSILLRYFERQPRDFHLFMPEEMHANEMLSIIHAQDPEFVPMQLGALLGASNVVTYHLLREGTRPYLRRLAMIWAREKYRTPNFYHILRRCTEEEVFARGLDIDEFWNKRKWNV